MDQYASALRMSYKDFVAKRANDFMQQIIKIKDRRDQALKSVESTLKSTAKASQVTQRTQSLAIEDLLDDSPSGITFKSFEIQKTLGQGSFGKVFKVNLKGDT